MNKNEIFCNNCGISGHLYKNCHYPIISLGIISFYLQENNIQFLLVKRKDSIGYSDFIRGKYELTNTNIIRLLDIMTLYEKDKLCKLTFDELWQDLWKVENTKKEHFIEYQNSKSKYLLLKKKFNLDDLIKSSNTNFINTEWGFPKGRREKLETDLECAIREFEEETDLTKNDYSLLKLRPIIEDINGSDNIKYRHIYYIARLNKVDVQLNKANLNQIKEISDIKLMNYETINDNLRPYHKEKLKIITSIIESLKFLKIYN